MSITVEILNPENLKRVRNLLGVTDDAEAVEIALEKTIEALAVDEVNPPSHDLPDEYWDELFSQPMLPSSVIDEVIRKEREDRF